MKAIQVDKNYIKDKIKCSYRHVKYDIEGWADAREFLPADYDLCLLKTPNKTLTGWYSGIGWDGMKVKESDEILYWKKKTQYQIEQ